MHVLLVVNTTASAVTERVRSEVERCLATSHDLDIVTTTHRGHATEVAASAVARGVEAIAVLGGDGTLNEVANALVGTDRVLAALPGGSTNVFARSVGLPRDPVEAATTTALALDTGALERIGVGEVTADAGAPRAFLCHTGIGWDAALVAEVERRRRGGRRRATIPLFVGAGVRTFVGGYDRRHAHVAVRASSVGDEVVPDGRFVLVMNSDPYTFLGRRPFRVAPDADRHSGLAVVTMRRLGWPTFLRTVSQALAGDGLHSSGHVEVRTRMADALVETLPSRPDRTPYQVDGDHLGAARRWSFRYRPDALLVVSLAGRAP